MNLLKEFLLPTGMTSYALAGAIRVPYQRVTKSFEADAGSLQAPPCGSPGSSAPLQASG